MFLDHKGQLLGCTGPRAPSKAALGGMGEVSVNPGSVAVVHAGLTRFTSIPCMRSCGDPVCTKTKPTGATLAHSIASHTQLRPMLPCSPHSNFQSQMNKHVALAHHTP